MDIIDIMLARAMTPQGQTETYVSIANAAAAKAEKAESDAQAAIDVVTAAAEDITAAQEAAADLLAAAQDALETAQEAQINTLDTEDIDAEIKNMTVNTNTVTGSNANTLQVITTYPDNTLNTQNITKLYKSTGSNEDGTMTQKAITDALGTKADASALAAKADKTYVDTQIAAIPAGSGNNGNATISFDVNDAGYITMVGNDGSLVASSIREETLIETLLQTGTFPARNAVGLDIDYINRSFTRIQEATNKHMGSDFDSYSMYGGRVRCNVADNGTINAFYGDPEYTEDGSNGQVMIYQPKFYYRRIIRVADELARGQAIRHEVLIISATEQSGFKLAPVFAGDLDYILLPAFDAGLVNDKLTSIAGVTPAVNLTIADAEAYARARGDGWHIMNMAAESANQMLEIVEFGMMNGQTAIEQGITNAPAGSNGNCLFITGSTSSLGNSTGHAESTQVNIGGNISTMTTDGYRAISYRGMENPWGNLWSMIGGLNITGNGFQNGGIPYICTDFNYTPTVSGSNYVDIGFTLPASSNGYVNAMGYGNEEYDWVYLPAECSTNATSLLPVGDGLWSVSGLNDTMIVATGGSYGQKELCGPFNYAADRKSQDSARYNYGAKILFIPTKNNIYTQNIAKWTTHMGG